MHAERHIALWQVQDMLSSTNANLKQLSKPPPATTEEAQRTMLEMIGSISRRAAQQTTAPLSSNHDRAHHT
jgi:hypothetical protein